MKQSASQGTVTVRSLAGDEIATICPVPKTAAALKEYLAGLCSVQPGLQRLVRQQSSDLDLDSPGIEDHEQLVPEETYDFMLLVVEAPLFNWNISKNPNSSLLGGSSTEIEFLKEDVDYVNVITQEPITRGTHFVEFVMHSVGDEQWCGLAFDSDRAGYRGSSQGIFYYSGRRGGSDGALHAPEERMSLQRFEHVKTGDVIGLLVSMEEAVAVFSLNGEIQGLCSLPGETQRLYFTTSLDRESDRVELRRVPMEDCPDAALQLLRSGCRNDPDYNNPLFQKHRAGTASELAPGLSATMMEALTVTASHATRPTIPIPRPENSPTASEEEDDDLPTVSLAASTTAVAAAGERRHDFRCDSEAALPGGQLRNDESQPRQATTLCSLLITWLRRRLCGSESQESLLRRA
eukprot:TRINITY_DN33477_c0_g1_i1.p1 TRINITY_DN33477_c0_g1~~TRINITY_DN33477_c0_g1_i1.p1  ORF type:complete len:406 (-),score=66.96 TRINITY_DN33477_c0_g1_i1:129-1346(-)